MKVIGKNNISSSQIKVIAKKSLLLVMHQVQVVDVEEDLIIWDLEKRSTRRDTAQKGSESNGKIYLKMRTDRNYPIFQRTYRPDLLTLLLDVIHESEEFQMRLYLN